MAYLTLIWLPTVTGFIGWFTNWVAIKMLFRPRKSFHFLGLNWQGLIPRRRAQIASTIAEIIERDILSSHTLQNELKQINLDPYLKEIARRLVQESLAQKLKGIPFIGNFITNSSLEMLERMTLESIEKEAQPLMDKLALEMEKQIHVKRIIEEKINEFDLDKLESMIMETARKEFKLIEWVGGILGFLVGVIQLLILWITGDLALNLSV